jgi:hypothetical protein
MGHALLSLLIAVSCTPENGVKEVPSDPAASITSHQSGGYVYESTSTLFQGAVSHVSHAGSALTASWLVDGVEACPLEAADETGITACELELATGETEITLQVFDPDGRSAVDRITLNVLETEAPSVQILSPGDGTAYPLEEMLFFSAVLFDQEDDPTELTYSWESSLEGELPLDSPVPSNGLIEGYHTLEEGQHAIQLTVEDSDGKLSIATVAIEITNENTPPECEIVLPEDGAQYMEAQAILFQASANDAETSSSQLAAIWSSDIDGFIGESTFDSNGLSNLPYADLSADTHVISFTTEDSFGETCTDQITVSVGNEPVLSVTSPADGDVYSLGESIPFEGTLSDNEPTENISISWSSDIDGEFSTLGANTAGNIHFSYADLSGGLHSLEIIATDSMGLTANQLIDIRVNTPPTGPEIELSPESAEASVDDLVCLINVEAVDAEGDPITYAISWEADGALWTGSVTTTTHYGDTIPAAELAEGQEWLCSVTADDGLATSAAVLSDTVVVQGSCSPNPAGTLLIESSGYCDPSPPAGWTQCAGWINTSADDVTNGVLDGCLNSNYRLRIKVWNQSTGSLEEDIYTEDANMVNWMAWDYHGGSIIKSVYTYWTGETTFFSTTNGGSACYTQGGVDAPVGTLTLGTGNGSSIIIAPGWDNEYEYRVNCLGQALPDRIIAVYN